MYRDWLKPLADSVLGVGLAVLTFPLCFLIAVALALSGKRVFFRQKRIGYRERPFTLIKFRTLRTAFGEDGKPLSDNLRTFPLGNFLRKTHLDELPQLWLVVLGRLSLIGPRPLLPEYLARYDRKQRNRHYVRPGLLGLSQCLGGNSLPWNQRLRLDAWYAEHQSFKLDLLIVCRSFSRKPSGVHLSEEFGNAGVRPQPRPRDV